MTLPSAKSLIPTAGRVAGVLIGAKAAQSFLGDGQGGIRDMGAQLAGGVVALILISKVL